jgi:hypothetical protein
MEPTGFEEELRGLQTYLNELAEVQAAVNDAVATGPSGAAPQ